MNRKIYFTLVIIILSVMFTRYSFSQQEIAVNQQPQIKLVPLNSGGNDFSLNDIQSATGYRVEIIYDFPEQLDVRFTGPVEVKPQSNMIYDVTLKLCSSEKEFENWCKSKNSPYDVSFSITSKDIKTTSEVSETGTFTFGKW